MIVRLVTCKVKSDAVEAFKTAATANHAGSLKEPGVYRFDVLQNDAAPSEFVLYEVYENEEATMTHKETMHYNKWKQTVEPLLAEPRTSTTFKVVAPEPEYY